MDPQTSVQPDQPEQAVSSKPDKSTKKIPILYRIYGLYCFVSAAIVLGLIITITVLSATKTIDLTAGSNNASLTFILTVIQFVLMGVESVVMIVFGISLLRNRRRHAAQMAYALIAINIISSLIEIMLHSFGENLIGGLFEAAVSWFMQTAFGAVAWDYTGSTIFGLFPDPIAEVFHGRTSALFMCMWGALGCVWIKLCLPWLLKLINLIPWKARYGVTTICTVLMLVNGVMTLEALDCWYQRESGYQPTSPVEEFYAKNFDDAYMEHRFQSMTITPEQTARVDAGTANPAS